MGTAVIALAASAAALVVAGILGGYSLRAHRRVETRLARALGQVGASVEALAHELADALDRFERDRGLLRALGGLRVSADLADVLQWTAETAAILTGARASVVRAVDEEGSQRTAAHGLPLARAGAVTVLWPADGARAVSFTFDYVSLEDDGTRVRSGLAVPIGTGTEPEAFIAVLSVDSPPRAERTIDTLETLAAQVAPAIELARGGRRHDRRDAADPLTGLGTRRTFHETLAREVAQAHWLAHPLALLVMDIDDFRSVNEGLGHVAADRVLAEIAMRVDETVHDGGLSCRTGADEFAVILPRSTVTDAERLYAVVQASLQRRPPEHVDRLAVSAGITELQSDDDPISVFGRAEQALQRAKQGGKGTAVVATANGDLRR